MQVDMEVVPLAHIDEFAGKVLAQVPVHADRATLITLQGDLGAGKTTFTQALARALGVEDTVQSPTYVLMKKHETKNNNFKTLVHIDAYRLEKPEQLSALNPEEFLATPSTLVCLEWPERVEGMLPTPDVALVFSSEGVGEGERRISIETQK